MTDALRDRLRQVVERIPVAMRAGAEADVERLRAAGARDDLDLFRLAIDTAVEEEVRLAAIWALSRLGDDRGVAALLAALDDAVPAVREAAARALGDTPSTLARSTVESLVPRLADPADDVRAAAAYALGMIGDARAVEPLVERLAQKGESPRVRGMIAEALADLRSPDGVPALLDALADASPEVRYWAAFALGEIGDPRALVRLNSVALSDRGTVPEHGDVAGEAARAIERIEESGIVEVVGLVEGGRLRPLAPVSTSPSIRLTTISARMAQPPESSELDLSAHEGRAVLARGYPHGDWLYRSELVEVGSPLLSGVVRAVLDRPARPPIDTDSPPTG